MSRKKWNNCFELQWQRRLHATSSREELALPFQSFSQNAKEQEKLKVSLTFPTQPLTILFLTVSKNKIAAMPENIGVVAILTVVLNYSILFPSFTFFLDGFHLAFGDKFEICIKTTDLM